MIAKTRNRIASQRIDLGIAYPLVNLLTADVVQPAVQILDPLHNVLHLILVLGLDLAGLTNGDINADLDSTQRRRHEAGGGISLRGETDSVLASIGSGEVEAAGMAVALGDNSVVIIEGLLDGDENLHVVVDCVGVGLWLDDMCLEAACSLFRIHTLAFN